MTVIDDTSAPASIATPADEFVDLPASTSADNERGKEWVDLSAFVHIARIAIPMTSLSARSLQSVRRDLDFLTYEATRTVRREAVVAALAADVAAAIEATLPSAAVGTITAALSPLAGNIHRFASPAGENS